MYIKVDESGNLIGHTYEETEGYILVDKSDIFDCEVGAYKYKYVDNALVALTEEEMLAHPLRIANFKVSFDNIRAQKFADTKWIRERHQEESELEVVSSLTTEQYNAWLAYWQALRDMPNQEGFDPENPSWPTEPAL